MKVKKVKVKGKVKTMAWKFTEPEEKIYSLISSSNLGLWQLLEVLKTYIHTKDMHMDAYKRIFTTQKQIDVPQ